MSDFATSSTLSSAATGLLNAQADKVIQQTGSPTAENKKIDQSAKDFESILLGTWLQGAERSFGSLPGGDDDGDADAGKEQYEGIAMQSLGSSMTAAGGIGIAKMISNQLHKAADSPGAVAPRRLPAHIE